jgi:hypothetical protein
MHDSCYPFVIRDHSSKPQLSRHASIAVAPPMLQNNLLKGRSQGQLLLCRPASPQITIESSSADLRQMAHSLDAQAALQRHPCPYFVMDAFAPEAVLDWSYFSAFPDHRASPRPGCFSAPAWPPRSEPSADACCVVWRGGGAGWDEQRRDSMHASNSSEDGDFSFNASSFDWN